ncbi:MAG: tetratricopeptide repeat protein [Planctomycetes bacterium]|nr:tetratricopeptide repeat protein [Planctomycetota bacterium]
MSGVRVERLDADGFALRLPDGEVHAFAWRDDPPLGLLVLQRGAREGVAEDRVEVLRRALDARDPVAARAALEALGAPDALDPAALLAAAPVSAVAVALPGGRWRLSWPTRTVGHDLTTRGQVAASDGVLVLTGEPCELATPALPVAGDGALEAALHLEGAPRAPFVGVDLHGPRGRRSYVMRWDAQSWRLEVDLGAGANVLREGTLPAQARSVRVRVTQSEVVVLLDGVERAAAPVSTRYEQVAVRVGAAAGPAELTDLTVEGALSTAWLEEADARLAAEVAPRLEELAERLAAGGAPAPPRLSTEDPQGLAAASTGALERLDSARRALAAGDVARAGELLDEVERESPSLLAALHQRALVAALEGDLAGAHRRLARALELDDGFAEARALLAWVLARAGRREQALAAAGRALEALPDQAHGYLAQARAAWASRAAEVGGEAEVVADRLRLARALAPTDPLVLAEARALRRATALEAGLPLRRAEAPHVVLAAAGAERPAGDLLKTLGALSLRYERELRRGAPPVALRAVLVAAGAPGLEGAAAAWEPEQDVLLVREGTALGWDLAHAVARAFVARAYGAPPAWLEVGLATTLAAPASAEDPPGLKEVLAAAPSWDADAWRNLLTMARGPLVNNTLARAKAWALVTYAQRQASAWDVVGRLLERAARGEAAAWPDDAPLDLASLDAQIAAGGRRR